MAHGPHDEGSAASDSPRSDVDEVVLGEPPLAATPVPTTAVPTTRASTTPASTTPVSTTMPRIVRARDDVTDAVRDSGPSVNVLRGRRRTVRRRVLRGVALVMTAGFVYFAACLFQVWSTGRADSTEAVDAIVVMGAAQYDGRPSPQLAARLDHVVELWPTGIAPVVVVTGGNIPGDRFTEAEASAQYLVERGIPESAVLLEDRGTTSYGSMVAVSEILTDRALGDILVVTDPYHALRSRMIAEEVGLTASVSSTDTSVVTGADSLALHVKEAGGVAVGRIIGFERLTDIVG